MLKKANINRNGILRRAEMIKRPSIDLVKPSGRNGILATASTPLVDRMAPRPFSPFYEETNLQMPRERPEQTAWARHYYDSDPLIGNCIDLHSTYPLSSFGVKCESPEIEKFFNKMLEKLNFNDLIYSIAREYYIIGEVFPLCQLDEDTGEWSEVLIQNPDFMDVKKHVLTTAVISLKPDVELQRIITSTDPDSIALREQLDPEIVQYVMAGKNIPLPAHLVSHIARKSFPYNVRGTSILTRVFKDLAYRDILREAQWTIASNHVTPLKIVKVGMADGSYRPGTDELLAVREMLEQATYDTNFTIVTHMGFEVSYVGATGQILPLDSEFEHIEDRILTGLFTSKAFTHGEGPCHSVDTEVLTEQGWKFYDDVTDGEKIACFDTKTSELKYLLPKQRHKWKFKGELCNFNTQRIDVSVTPDHRMFVKRDNMWLKVDAQDVKLHDKFLCHIEWNDGENPEYFEICGKQVKAKTWMKFLGYWISEGSMNVNPSRKTKSTTWQVRITQNEEKNPETYADIKSVLDDLGFKYSVHLGSSRNGCSDFIICSKEFVEFMVKEMDGDTKSKDKHIPRKYLNLHKSLLLELHQALMNGDGNIRMQGTKKNKAYFTYTTISNKLADDMMEISFKCGFSPVKRWDKFGGTKGIWRILWGENKDKLLYPGLGRKKCFSKQAYDDYVWCFEVPTEAFITRRNGKIGQHFNTYANASVALEVLQQRYVSFRNIIERWLERKIFAPISRIQDFTKYRNGVRELIIPKVNWGRINLKNNREYQGALENLVRDNKVSLHSLMEALDLNYDSEIKNIKTELEDAKEIAYKLQTPYMGKENINVSSPGADEMGSKPAAPAEGADGGMGGGDMGSGGGGGDMGAGGGMDLGGGGDSGMGDLGGGDLAGGAPAGGAPAGGGAPPPAV